MQQVETIKTDALELRRLLGLTSNQYVQKLLTSEAEKLEKQISSLEDRATKPVQKVSPRPHVFTVKVTNYAWDQSEKFVKLYVTISSVHTLPAESIISTFHQKSVELQVSGLDGKNYSFVINNLMHDIQPTDSYHKVKSDMVVLFLRKSSVQNWSYVTESEKKSKEPRIPKPDENEDPSQSLMSLMKQMYDDGDDEMKRTIAKAWTEAREKQSTDML